MIRIEKRVFSIIYLFSISRNKFMDIESWTFLYIKKLEDSGKWAKKNYKEKDNFILSISYENLTRTTRPKETIQNVQGLDDHNFFPMKFAFGVLTYIIENNPPSPPIISVQIEYFVSKDAQCSETYIKQIFSFRFLEL